MKLGAFCQLCSLTKLFLEIFGNFLENHLHHSAYWKLKDILNMSSVTDVFLGISQKYSKQLFIEKLLMDVPYFANKKPLDQCFWWGNTKQKLVEVKPPQSWPWKQMVPWLWLLWWFLKFWQVKKGVPDKYFEKIRLCMQITFLNSRLLSKHFSTAGKRL